MPVGPPLPIDTMFDIQEQTARETREELQHNLSVITEMNSLPVFGVGKLPSTETLMVSYDGLVKSAKARKSRGVQEDDRDTMLGHEKFYSKEKVCNLSPVYLRDMLIEKRYHHKYLLTRLATTPVRSSSNSCIVSDPQGSSIILETYNYPLFPLPIKGHAGKVDPDEDDFAKVWRKGRYLLIKEPKLNQMYESTTRGDLKFCLVAWSVTDLVWLEEDDPLVTGVDWLDARRVVFCDEEDDEGKKGKEQKSLIEWKDDGNKAYGKRDFLEADNLYTRGIAQHTDNPDLHLLYLNRSATNLALERYPAALSDVDIALDLVQRKLQTCGLASEDYHATIKWDEKGRIRRAKCFYKLREWKKARDTFVDVLERFPDAKEAQTGPRQSVDRLKEQAKGEYDYLALFLQVREKNQPRLDIADYIGPVEIARSCQTDRTLKTTRAVKAGELLLANKAIAAVFPSDWKGGRRKINNNLLRFIEDTPCASRLPAELTYKWLHQPQLRSTIEKLPRGPGIKQPKVFPVTDMYTSKPKDELKEVPLDPNMIDRVASFASYTFDSLNYIGTGVDTRNPQPIGDPCAVFPYSSFIHHSCLGNAVSACIGDVQFVRATEDIPANTEITMSYIYDHQYYRRQRLLEDRFGLSYRCGCALCVDDRKEGNQKMDRRRRLKMNLEIDAYTGEIATGGSLSKVRKDFKRCQSTLESMRQTYSPTRSSSLAEMDCLPALSRMGFCCTLIGNITGADNERDAIDCFEKALQCIGVILADNADKPDKLPIADVPRHSPILCPPRAFSSYGITLMANIVSAYSAMGKNFEAKRWADAMVWADHVMVSPSLPLFKEMNRAIIAKFHIDRYL